MSKVNIDVSDFLINNNSKRLFDAILQYLTEKAFIALKMPVMVLFVMKERII